MAESHRATLDELIQAIAENMTAGEIMRTIIVIKIHDFSWKIKKFARRRKNNG